LTAASSGQNVGLRKLAAARTDIARHIAAVDRALDRALRERTHAIALIYPRRRAAARALAHLRAIDRALTSIYDLEGIPSRNLPVDFMAYIHFRIGILERALFDLPSYEMPVDHSEIRGWIRLLGRELGLDIGLHIRFSDTYEGLRNQVRELAEMVEQLQARVHELLNAEDAP
jgi:hypothetical protein